MKKLFLFYLCKHFILLLWLTFKIILKMIKYTEKSNWLCFATLFLLVLLTTKYASCQNYGKGNSDKPSFISHLYFGGGFGLQFGSVTLIEVSPLVGYKITPKFSVGVSPTYKFYKYNDVYGKQTTHVFGGSLFSRYMIWENIFAHIEYETLSYNIEVPGYLKTRQQFDSFFVGGGYKQPVGLNSAMYILALWNLNDTPNSPYINPVIRVGFSVGL